MTQKQKQYIADRFAPGYEVCNRGESFGGGRWSTCIEDFVTGERIFLRKKSPIKSRPPVFAPEGYEFCSWNDADTSTDTGTGLCRAGMIYFDKWYFGYWSRSPKREAAETLLWLRKRGRFNAEIFT